MPEQLKLKVQLTDEGRTCYFFVSLQGKLQHVYIDQKHTEAASHRLLLPDLPLEYKKVIYIDCDIIARNDSVQFYYSTDLGINYLAAVLETSMDLQSDHLKTVGCNPNEYINSGFLIMNLELVRKDNMVEKFIEVSRVDYLEFSDRDALNQFCKDRILALPPYYNSIRTFYLLQYKEFFLQKYAEQDWLEVHRHGIVHYTGAKLWNQFTV